MEMDPCCFVALEQITVLIISAVYENITVQNLVASPRRLQFSELRSQTCIRITRFKRCGVM